MTHVPVLARQLEPYAGLRIEEALTLQWRDVDLPAGMLTIRESKGGESRRVSLTRSLIQTDLTRTDRFIGGTQSVARQRLKVIAARAKSRYRGWHAFRHYAGIRLVRQTGSLEHAARHLGHASSGNHPRLRKRERYGSPGRPRQLVSDIG